MNGGLVVLHWIYSPDVYYWIENAPLPAAIAESSVATETVEEFTAAEESGLINEDPLAVPTQRSVADEQDDFSWAM